MTHDRCALLISLARDHECGTNFTMVLTVPDTASRLNLVVKLCEARDIAVCLVENPLSFAMRLADAVIGVLQDEGLEAKSMYSESLSGGDSEDDAGLNSV